MEFPVDVQRVWWNAGAIAIQVQEEQLRPSVVFKPRIFLDGNQYCALFGENIMDGCAGFGESPDAAMRAFDLAWRVPLNQIK